MAQWAIVIKTLWADLLCWKTAESARALLLYKKTCYLSIGQFWDALFYQFINFILCDFILCEFIPMHGSSWDQYVIEISM